MEKLYIESDGAGQFKRGQYFFWNHVSIRNACSSDLLIKFNQQFPKMNCYVYDKRHVELEKSLLSGELDLAVTHIQKTQKKPALSYDCFLKDPMVVIASPQRKLSQEPGVIIWKNEKPVIDVRTLKNEKFIYPKRIISVGRSSMRCWHRMIFCILMNI